MVTFLEKANSAPASSNAIWPHISDSSELAQPEPDVCQHDETNCHFEVRWSARVTGCCCWAMSSTWTLEYRPSGLARPLPCHLRLRSGDPAWTQLGVQLLVNSAPGANLSIIHSLMILAGVCALSRLIGQGAELSPLLPASGDRASL